MSPRLAAFLNRFATEICAIVTVPPLVVLLALIIEHHPALHLV